VCLEYLLFNCIHVHVYIIYQYYITLANRPGCVRVYIFGISKFFSVIWFIYLLSTVPSERPMPIVYVPSHLYHMLFELFKNAMRAVMEHHESAPPPIQVNLVTGREDVSVKVIYLYLLLLLPTLIPLNGVGTTCFSSSLLNTSDPVQIARVQCWH
jgi:hypothetical protein